MALPSGVRGPVDFCALRRLAAICLAVAMWVVLSWYCGSSLRERVCGAGREGAGKAMSPQEQEKLFRFVNGRGRVALPKINPGWGTVRANTEISAILASHS